MEDSDPPEVIFAFLCQLPTTIRNEILLDVVLYAIGDDSIDINNLQNAVGMYLVRPNLRGISAVLCAAAVVDFSTAKYVADPDSTRRSLKAITTLAPGVIADKSLFAHPLRQKHFEQAHALWKTVRANELSQEKLLAFERGRLRPP